MAMMVDRVKVEFGHCLLCKFQRSNVLQEDVDQLFVASTFQNLSTQTSEDAVLNSIIVKKKLFN